jgi:hypothetical protein
MAGGNGKQRRVAQEPEKDAVPVEQEAQPLAGGNGKEREQ